MGETTSAVRAPKIMVATKNLLKNISESIAPPPTTAKTTITVASPPAVVFSGTNTDMFVNGSDGGVWWKRNTGVWTALNHTTLPGTMPAAAYVNGILTVYIQGTDHAVYAKSLTGTTWSNWVSIALNLK